MTPIIYGYDLQIQKTNQMANIASGLFLLYIQLSIHFIYDFLFNYYLVKIYGFP